MAPLFFFPFLFSLIIKNKNVFKIPHSFPGGGSPCCLEHKSHFWDHTNHGCSHSSGRFGMSTESQVRVDEAPWMCSGCCFSAGDLCPDDHLHLLSYLPLIFLGTKVPQPLTGALLWAEHVGTGGRKQAGGLSSHSVCLRTPG